MSLINTMLRDLENRRASEIGRRDWQREIRALPPARAMSWWSRQGLFYPVMGLTVLLAAGLGWYFYAQKAQGGEDKSADALPLAMVQTMHAPLPSGTPGAPAKHSVAALAKPEARVAPVLNVPAEEIQEKPLTRAERRRLKAEEKAAKKAAAKAAAEEAARARLENMPVLSGSTERISKRLTSPGGRELAEAEYKRGREYSAAGQSGEAVAAWYGALSHDPSFVPARQSLVRALTEAQRSDEAAALLSEGLDSQPAQINWAISLARMLTERQDIAAASRVLAKSQPYAGNSAEYAGFQGHLAYRQGQFGLAVERYQSATQLMPGEGRWWFGLGQAKEAEGKSSEAREAFRRALASGNLPASLVVLAEQKMR